MPIPLASNFKLGAALPLDSRFTKNNLTDLNAIPSGERYIGLEVYVISESKFYLWTGSTWIERGSSANITYPPQGIVVSTGTDWDTSIVPSTGYMYYTGSNWQFKNEEYALSSHTHTKAQITDFSHNHTISEVTNLQSSLDAKINTSDVVITATANKILKLDANAKLPASITGNADGNASTATKLQTARAISLSGDVTGSANFDGSANAAISTALSNTGVAAGTYTKLTVDSKGRATAGTNLSASDLPTHNHTKSQITDFSHTHIISDVTNLQTSLDSKVNTSDVVTVATANKILKLDSNAKLPASITGNSATATKLETARTITIGSTGKSFDGSGNVSWSLSEIGAAATSHTHTKSQITDFAHTHPISEITSLQTELNNKIPLTGAAITGAIGETYNYMTRIMNPTGGMLSSSTDSIIGMLRIELPVGYFNTMISFDLIIYNYFSSNDGVVRMRVGGYMYNSTQTWYNVSAYSLVSDSTRNNTVRFGDENGKCVIFVGDTTTTWSYPKVMISDVMLGHSSYDYNNFNDGWNLSFVTSTGSASIKQTITPKLVADEAQLANAWKTARTITIGSTGKSVNGSANVSWSLTEIGAAAASHTHSNYTPFASNSQTIPMNTPSGAWYRIATSASGVGRNDGIFELELSIIGQQRLSFRASSMYNYDNSIQIAKMGGSKFGNDNTFFIQSARVVYYPNKYSSQYAYVEVFVTNPDTTINATLNVRMVDAIGWSLTTGAGSIPTNYAAKELSVKNYNPIYNTNDKSNVIAPSSGVLNIDLRLARNETVVSNITQNTTINISGLYDGAAGTIMLYLNGTYTITLGTMTNDVGNSVTKHTSGTFSSLAAGYYIIAYRVLPDASGTWRVFISISPKYS